MAYQVPGVPLIPQTMEMSCWFASANMVVTWRRNELQACQVGQPSPWQVPSAVQRRADNNGLSLSSMLQFARDLGFEAVPPMSPTLDAIETWLKHHGPLWFAGEKSNGAKKYGHVWVIVGRDGDQLTIHDPEPMNWGTVATVGVGWLTAALGGYAAFIPTNFLHYP